MIKRKGIILLFLLSSLFSFGGASNLQPEKKPSHHPLIEKLGYIPTPSDTPFNRTFASDEEKLKYGLFIEDFPIFEPMPSIESLYEKETIKRRLESSGTLMSARSGTPIIKGEEIKVNRYIPNPNIEMSEL